MAKRFILGNYIIASIVVAGGLFVYYGFLGGVRMWLASPNPMALFWIFLFGLIAVITFVVGLTGFLMRYDRETRIIGDQIVVPSDYKFEKRETVIPLGRIWRLYSNLKNDFPAVFIVWKDERDRCRCIYVDKEDLPDFSSEVARLGEKIPVDTESYAVASYVWKDVKEKLGCEPTW